MLTTCSFRFRFCASTRLAVPFAAIRLKLQSRLTRRVGQRLYAAMILISAAIEHHAGNAFVFRALRHGLADPLRAFYVAAFTTQIFFCRCRGSKGVSLLIVDHLRINMIQTAENGEPRPFLRSRHAAPNTLVNTSSNFVSTSLRHYLPPAPVLPAFLRSTSPVSRTPLF